MPNVVANGVELCVETFGAAADPAVLLVSGAGASMDWWDEEFCARLTAGRRFVIRYDHRDTGRSVSYEPGAPPYTFDDLVADAVGLLDALGLATAHVVGISMGGAIGQLMALDHAGRVATLTLISTSPGAGNADLPPMSAELRAYFAGSAAPDWTDRAAVLHNLVDVERHLAGSLPFDEAATREIAGRVVDRTANIASSMANHMAVERRDPWRERLGEISAPTLVIHGTEDPLFPMAHALALTKEIPGAQLLPLERVGHEVPPRAVWNVVVPALLRHTSGDWEEQADRLAAASLAGDDPTGWFERLYAAADAGEVAMPWDREQPQRLLAEWAQARGLTGGGRRALVIGCGLGGDAEYVAGLGFDTVAFDIADTAIRVARRRHPDSTVEYLAADLLNPPAQWLAAFDLVVEVYTVQALPDPPRRQAIANVVRMVGPGGTLIVIAAARDEAAGPAEGPPWPLTRAEIDAFAAGGLTPVRIDELADRRWRAEFHRPEK